MSPREFDDPEGEKKEHRGGLDLEAFPVLSATRQPKHPNAPLVSIVITCYNQARFLGEAIESVLGQAYQQLEIIVVDDGSEDDPAQVATRYKRVLFIRQENQGVSAARNAGLARSNGDYVVFLDADDRLLPEALQIGLATHLSGPEVALVFGRYRSIYYDGAPGHTPEQPPVEGDPYAELLRRNYIGVPGMAMFRRAVFDIVGRWNISADHCGDWELYLRIARSFPIRGHRRPVVEYRLHDNNTSRDHGLMLKRGLAVLRSQLCHCGRSERLLGAYYAGVRTVRNSWGEGLFEEMRAQMRAKRWAEAASSALTLMFYYPQSFTKHTRTKISVLGGKERRVGRM